MAGTVFQVESFMSRLKGGGARPNLFQCSISSAPSIVSSSSFNSFSFMCKGAALPASTVGTIEVPYQGRALKIAGDREFAALSTTIINDEGFEQRNALEKWMNAFSSMKNNIATVKIGDRAKYTAEMSVTTFKKDGTEDQVVNYIDCWPSTVSTIDLSWDSTNAIQEYTVTWEYEYFTHAAANVL